MEFTHHSPAHKIGRLARLLSSEADRATPHDVVPSGFARAVEGFAHGDWSEAFEALVTLADGGDPEAARIALLMAGQGARLFGRAFPASPDQRQRWQRAADRASTPR